MTIYDAAMQYKTEKVPLVILAGEEYGTGSSRDWAAKGTMLLGVRAVLASSFERIHRSNLVGMGVLPLCLPQSWQQLGLTGEETFDIPLGRFAPPALDDHRPRHGPRRQRQRIPSQSANRHPRRTRLLPQRRHFADRATKTVGGLARPD